MMNLVRKHRKLRSTTGPGFSRAPRTHGPKPVTLAGTFSRIPVGFLIVNGRRWHHVDDTWVSDDGDLAGERLSAELDRMWTPFDRACEASSRSRWRRCASDLHTRVSRELDAKDASGAGQYRSPRAMFTLTHCAIGSSPTRTISPMRISNRASPPRSSCWPKV